MAVFISAVAFATILAVVSSLLIAGAFSAANDLVVSLSGRQLDERMRPLITEFAAIALGELGILLGLACERQGVANWTFASYRRPLGAPKGGLSKPYSQRGCRSVTPRDRIREFAIKKGACANNPAEMQPQQANIFARISTVPPNLVERRTNNVKQFRRAATHCDQLAANCFAALLRPHLSHTALSGQSRHLTSP